MNSKTIIRQGDVCLIPSALPPGCTAVPLDNGRIVLAHGEVTGHAHAIDLPQWAREIADGAIARARLWQSPNGDRYLEVRETVALTHEEHTAHTIPPGVYELPVQVEWTSEHQVRKVAD